MVIGLRYFKNSIKVMMYSNKTLKKFIKIMMFSIKIFSIYIFHDFKKIYKSQVIFNYNFYKLSKSIPVLKKSLTFIGIRLLITFNNFSSMSINTHPLKFSYDFSKDLKRFFHQVREAN